MSAFEFLFSFYGLLLGLALTEVIGGLSRALNERATRPIGWLIPLLAILLTLDLMTFWASAWIDLKDITFSTRLLLFASVSPMIYYFAAKQAFPDSDSAAASLDDHFYAHRVWVIGGVILANQLSYLPVIDEPGMWSRFFSNVIYVGPLAVAAFVRPKWLIILILVAEIGWLLSLMSGLLAHVALWPGA